MKTKGLFKALSDYHPLSYECKEAIKKEISPLNLPKNFLLIEPPKVAEFAYFLVQGFAMAYTYRPGDDRKHIQHFWGTGEFIVPWDSFFERKPAVEFVQLMTHSQLLCLNIESVLNLFESYPETNTIHRLMMTRRYQRTEQRLVEIKTMSNKERYEKLRVDYPGIEQLVSQEQIASYLGITPQSLSRIRRLP